MIADMFATQYFYNDYTEARQAFLDGALVAGATVESFQNPNGGPENCDLYTDVASLGPSDAANYLVLISATHGVEGFGGAGIQTGLLREKIADQLGPKTGLILIHALNPYGFAYLRRFNEDNVDLNRNFVDHSKAYPENKAYEELADLIAPRSFSPLTNLRAILGLSWYRLRHGSARLQHAVTHGQYTRPHGLFYGGRFATWSNMILREIIERYLLGGLRVVVIDLHTGLGPYGHGELIMNSQENSPAYLRAVKWWGRELVKSTEDGRSVSAHLSGTVQLAFQEGLPDAELTVIGLEFGTLPPTNVFRAIRAENWLHHHGGVNFAGGAKIKQQLLRAFYPDDDLWKCKIWAQAKSVVEELLTHLQEQDI